ERASRNILRWPRMVFVPSPFSCAIPGWYVDARAFRQQIADFLQSIVSARLWPRPTKAVSEGTSGFHPVEHRQKLQRESRYWDSRSRDLYGWERNGSETIREVITPQRRGESREADSLTNSW